ncbi:amidohydrolase family protein [Fulvivirga sp. M361]|uniref:amidohydrolase family protein n=1 Tax=Fulvivirga sp. M361 TaxID=2594266 RepID=UPI0011798C0E|nr:amidohydrolase family protein [Fulvivirga sp. M361]TRX57627.1 amidohydrolase family protein [Fulvivirga sp. M361]
MKVIDAHQHFWNYDPAVHTWMSEQMDVIKKDFTPDLLKKELEAHDVNGCVAVQADQSEDETMFLIELARSNEFIKGVVGWVDLQNNKIEEYLSRYVDEPVVKGFRHVVQDEADPEFMLRKSFQHGISVLGDHDFTYDILIFPKQLTAALQLVLNFPNQPFVIDHLAKPDIRDHEMGQWQKYMYELGKHDHVYCKISGMVTEADWHGWSYEDFLPYLDSVLEAFGPQRLMYGSDWPVCLLSATYGKVKHIVDQYISTLSSSEQSLIMGENAIKFYQL